VHEMIDDIPGGEDGQGHFALAIIFGDHDAVDVLLLQQAGGLLQRSGGGHGHPS